MKKYLFYLKTQSYKYFQINIIYRKLSLVVLKKKSQSFYGDKTKLIITKNRVWFNFIWCLIYTSTFLSNSKNFNITFLRR